MLLTNPHLISIPGKGDSGQGVKCSGSKMPGDSVRRRSRPVSRPDGAVSDRRTLARHELLVHGRLRRPRLLLRRDGDAAGRAQGALPRTNHDPARQPRIETDHSSLRLLRRMSAQIRQSERVEVLHRPVRLSAAHRPRRRTNLLLARRPLAVHRHIRPY